MECVKCRKTAEIELAHLPGPVCEQCFVELLEKRVRKHIRKNNFFQRNDKIYVKKDESYNFSVTLWLRKSILKHMPKEFTGEKVSRCKVVVPWNMDLELQLILGDLFGPRYHVEQGIRLLSIVSQEEVALFAEINKLQGKEPDPINNDIAAMLTNIEGKHPDIKFAMLSAFKKI